MKEGVVTKADGTAERRASQAMLKAKRKAVRSITLLRYGRALRCVTEHPWTYPATISITSLVARKFAIRPKWLYGHVPALGPRKRPHTGQPADRPVDRSGYAYAATSRTASVAHAGRRAVARAGVSSMSGDNIAPEVARLKGAGQ